MSRRFLLVLLGALSSLPLAAFGSATAQSSDKGAARPNFVIILTDDQGYGDLGCYGSTVIDSPNLDRMAEEGMRFTDFYSASASCTPARAALMTGSYPRRIGMEHVLLPGSAEKRTGKIVGLNPEEITIAEILKSEGYATACIGKWHLGDDPIFMPQNHGFDEHFGFPYSNDMVPARFPDLPLLRNGEVLELNPDQDYITRRFTEAALEFIESKQEQPFFLYLAHSMPHRAIHASPEFTKRFTKEQLDAIKPGEDKASRDFLYPAAVEEIDWSVGEILNKLRDLGLEENTMVVFTSDNGPMLGSTGGLRGKKGSNFEGGHRVPGIIQWKGRIPEGSVCSEIVTTMDLLPTFAKLAGTEAPTDRVIDGYDISPLLEASPKEKSSYEAFFYTHGGFAVRSGKWKWVRGKRGGLFDLSVDVNERTSVSANYPEVAERMDGLIDSFLLELESRSRPAGTL